MAHDAYLKALEAEAATNRRVGVGFSADALRRMRGDDPCTCPSWARPYVQTKGHTVWCPL